MNHKSLALNRRWLLLLVPAWIAVIAWGGARWFSNGRDSAAVEKSRDIRSGPVARTMRWENVEEFSTGIAVFETVFWEPRDTTSLRELIRRTPLVALPEVFLPGMLVEVK